MCNLRIILGPMFAGKSTLLINNALGLIESGINKNQILIINNKIDNRYNNESQICTHDGKTMPSIALTNLFEIFNNENINICEIKHIFIDEAQFFNDLYDFVIKLLIDFDINIYISGLDGDFEQKPFYDSHILDLIPYSTDIIKLKAKCSQCLNPAPFTKRVAKSNEKILVGGANDYQPVCLKHLK